MVVKFKATRDMKLFVLGDMENMKMLYEKVKQNIAQAKKRQAEWKEKKGSFGLFDNVRDEKLSKEDKIKVQEQLNELKKALPHRSDHSILKENKSNIWNSIREE